MIRDEGDGPDMPLRFAEAIGTIRGAIGGCETAAIPTDTILAAMMAELMPRLVQAYGPGRVVDVLTSLAARVALDVPEPLTRH
jgi:hypothetical protein